MVTAAFLFQVLVNLFLAVAVYILYVRANRPQKDDPRLAKGLQLLSNKIAVLEDLNDRTEIQAQQMIELIEQKTKELQQKIIAADQHVSEVRLAIEKSLEVSQIFQDKIPHQEYLDRQQSIKYMAAAKLAHQGVSVEEIIAQTSLPRSEAELIAKVNRDELTFHEAELPAWARMGLENKNLPVPEVSSKGPDITDPLKSLGDRFRQAIQSNGVSTSTEVRNPNHRSRAGTQVNPSLTTARAAAQELNQHFSRVKPEPPQGTKKVQKILFPRIDAPLSGGRQ